jgi:hypothetical protein
VVASGSLLSATAGASIGLVGGTAVGRSWSGAVAGGSAGVVGGSGGSVMDAGESTAGVLARFTLGRQRQKW